MHNSLEDYARSLLARLDDPLTVVVSKLEDADEYVCRVVGFGAGAYGRGYGITPLAAFDAWLHQFHPLHRLRRTPPTWRIE